MFRLFVIALCVLLYATSNDTHTSIALNQLEHAMASYEPAITCENVVDNYSYYTIKDKPLHAVTICYTK